VAIGEQRQPAQAELELGGRSSGYNMRTGTRFLIRVYIQVLTWAGPIVSSYGKKRPSGCVQSRNGPSIERLKKKEKNQRDFPAAHRPTPPTRSKIRPLRRAPPLPLFPSSQSAARPRKAFPPPLQSRVFRQLPTHDEFSWQERN
jgi:hypothetical protein